MPDYLTKPFQWEPAGLHAFWRYGHDVRLDLVDLRLRTLEVQGLEIQTRDKATLRVSLVATYRFVDAAQAARAVKAPLDHLYGEAERALRTAIGARTLDGVLEAIEREVAAHLSEGFTGIGDAARLQRSEPSVTKLA